MLERYCDILVIGNEIPGLVAAAFLAKRGLSVQIVDSDLFAGHEKLPDPYCLTNLSSKLLRSILGRLNVPEMTIQNFLTEDGTLQFVFPQHRIDVYNNPLQYFEEIEREFPECYDAVKLFYENQAKERHQINVTDLFQHILPSTWKESRVFKKYVNDNKLNVKSADYTELTQKDKRLAQFITAQYILAYQNFSENPFEPLPPYTQLHFC